MAQGGLKSALQSLLYVLGDEVNGDSVILSSGDNDVGKLFGGRNVHIKGWLHKRFVLHQHAFERAASFSRVSTDPSDEAGVVISVYKYLHVHQIPTRFLRKGQDAFKQHHVSRVHGRRLGRALVRHKIV